jgi:general stress protein YciG
MEKQKRGFACISPERRREIASMGGKSVPPEKRTYSIDKSKAVESGVKGGVGRARSAWEKKKHLLDREG